MTLLKIMKSQPSKIVHFVAKTTQLISEVLSEHFGVPNESQLLLFSLGAIYKNKKRVLVDEKIQPKEQLQIYLMPKRYPIEQIDWKSLIVKETDAFLVLNKPAGIPVHSTDDNLIENVLFQLRTRLDQELWITHRLDTIVSGLMVLAKTPEYQFFRWI
ncbi:MAG: hypothetical protein EBR01_01400 [Proteobacteria bacterium]|nr:hypothetical protein [Pseudomonadota bacterium]